MTRFQSCSIAFLFVLLRFRCKCCDIVVFKLSMYTCCTLHFKMNYFDKCGTPYGSTTLIEKMMLIA